MASSPLYCKPSFIVAGPARAMALLRFCEIASAVPQSHETSVRVGAAEVSPSSL